MDYLAARSFTYKQGTEHKKVAMCANKHVILFQNYQPIYMSETPTCGLYQCQACHVELVYTAYILHKLYLLHYAQLRCIVKYKKRPDFYCNSGSVVQTLYNKQQNIQAVVQPGCTILLTIQSRGNNRGVWATVRLKFSHQ